MTTSLTVVEKLLLAAQSLHRDAKSFSAEDLVVTAWRMYPDTFGLSGYANQYPDSNRVFTKIMGTEGLRGKGWLRKIGEKQYMLTQKGFSDADALLRYSGDKPDESKFFRAQLGRSILRLLEKIVESKAATKYLSNKRNEITFADACSFWDISVRSNANILAARFAEIGSVLGSAVSQGGKGVKLPRRNVSYAELNGLIKLHHEMQEQFDEEISIIRKRTDERSDKRRRLPQHRN